MRKTWLCGLLMAGTVLVCGPVRADRLSATNPSAGYNSSPPFWNKSTANSYTAPQKNPFSTTAGQSTSKNWWQYQASTPQHDRPWLTREQRQPLWMKLVTGIRDRLAQFFGGRSGTFGRPSPFANTGEFGKGLRRAQSQERTSWEYRKGTLKPTTPECDEQ